MFQTITLNVPINLSSEEWAKVATVYRQLDGWVVESEWPRWYGDESADRFIWVSAEPSGLLFSGEVEPSLWVGWVTVLCAKLSLALGREVHDAEM